MEHCLDLSFHVFASQVVVNLFKKFEYLPNKELLVFAVDTETNLPNKQTNKQTNNKNAKMQVS